MSQQDPAYLRARAELHVPHAFIDFVANESVELGVGSASLMREV
jgi:hypothetical protein